MAKESSSKLAWKTWVPVASPMLGPDGCTFYVHGAKSRGSQLPAPHPSEPFGGLHGESEHRT